MIQLSGRNLERLNVVIESNQTTYYDSKGQFTPNGKTWYYMIEVQNQYGKSEFSGIKSGMTKPWKKYFQYF